VPIVKGDVEAVEVWLTPSSYVGHKRLWRDTGFLCRNHDGGAVGVVGTDKVDFLTFHALVPHPNIGLDVLHDVANVEVAIGIGQCGRDEKAALCHGYGA
jgi:hypothetical protein